MRKHWLLTLGMLMLALTVRASERDLTSPQTASDIEQRLIDDGFENVRAHCQGGQVTVALEDNHYRGIYYGLAQALRLITDEGGDTIRLIALQDGMPRLTLDAIHADGDWSLEATPGGSLPKTLRKKKEHESSAWKLDLIPYPAIALSDDYIDDWGSIGWERFWCIQLYVNPTLEMTLWRGARLTLQEKVMVFNNDKAYPRRRLTPGYMTLRQRLVSNRWLEMSAAAGIFNTYRNGLDLKADLHVPAVEMGMMGNWQMDLGLIAGWTGPWYMKEDSRMPVLCQWDKLHALAHINLTETRTHTQLDIKAGRFVLGDRGVRIDAQRHFHDRSIGVYLTLCEPCTAIGFDFSLPIGPWKRGKHRSVNVRLPESYYFTFGDAVKGERNANNHDIPTYKTYPQENYSADYWQAEAIRDWILGELGMRNEE